MDLVGRSLNAIDSIFTTQRQAAGAATCPAGTHHAGYTMDARKKWRVLCLSVLYVEDVEDLYLFGFMITGFLLIGVGGYLGFQEIRRLMATGGKLPVEPVYRSINTLTQTLCELSRKHDALVSKQEARWSIQEAHRGKMGTTSDSMRVMGNTLEKLVVRMEGN